MKSHHVLTTIALVSLIGLPVMAAAEAWDIVSTAESKPINEIWLNPGLVTYHFPAKVLLNDNNFGIGGEYRYSTTASIVLGEFHNSDWKTSDYAGWYWRPISIGSASVGLEMGGINGYTRINHGGWLPVVVPVASFEYKNMGANIIFVPSYKEQLYGGISVQFKVKLY